MERMKMKMIKTGLVVFLLIAGFSSIYVSASYPDSSNATNLLELKFETPSNGESFLEPMLLQTTYIKIRLVNQFNIPVFDAIIHVYISGQNQDFLWEGFTDLNGIAYWPEPNVDNDITYRIIAEKFVNANYIESTIYVTIKNRCLKVSASYSPVNEGADFFCIVKDQDNQPVYMATVIFSGKIFFTDGNGITPSIKAPYVSTDTNFTIDVSAPFRGYDSNSSIVTVHNYILSPSHMVYGQVRDYDFNPIQNVKIMTSKGNLVYTDENGNYSFDITSQEGGEWVILSAILLNYSTQIQRIWVSSADSNSIHVNFWFAQQDGNSSVSTEDIEPIISQKTNYQSGNYN